MGNEGREKTVRTNSYSIQIMQYSIIIRRPVAGRHILMNPAFTAPQEEVRAWIR